MDGEGLALYSSDDELLKFTSSSDEEEVETFNVAYTKEAVDHIKNLSYIIYKHDYLWQQIKDYQPLISSTFTTLVEKTMATFIALNNNTEYQTSLLITKDHVIKTMKFLILNMINYRCTMYYSHDSISNTYAKLILSRIFDCDTTYIDIIIQCIIFFVRIRSRPEYKNWLPPELFDVAENSYYINHDACPINREELEVLYKVFKSRKYIYVKILLGTLYQLQRHIKIIESNNTQIDDLLEISNSSWMSLLLLNEININNNQYKTYLLSDFIKRN